MSDPAPNPANFGMHGFTPRLVCHVGDRMIFGGFSALGDLQS